MTDETDDLVNRLFEVTERYECLLMAVESFRTGPYIDGYWVDDLLQRAKQIERERGLLKGDEG